MAQHKREAAQPAQQPRRQEQRPPEPKQQAEFGMPSGLDGRGSLLAGQAEQPRQPALLRLQQQAGNRAVQRLIARAQQGGGQAQAAPDVVERIRQAQGGGQALDPALRAQFEPAFGHDFGRLRVHVDSEADTLSRAVQAQAFTTGSDLFFRQGTYQPGSASGRALVAHELTHVVQQHGAPMPATLTVSQPGDAAEHEAEQVSHAVMQHEQQTPQQAAPAQVQRQAAEATSDQTAQLQLQARADAGQIRAILQGNTWLGPYNQREIMAIVERWAGMPAPAGARQTGFDLLIAALRQSTYQVGTVVSQLTSAFDQLFARLSSENAARLQQLVRTRANLFSGERALELARFEVSKDDVLDAAQLSAEVAAAFATGGGSVLAQIVIWLGTTLPGLYRKASALINFVETIRNLKLDDVQRLFSAQGFGSLLVRALFGELPPLAAVERDREEPQAAGGGREERGLVAVFHSMIRAFKALRGVYAGVVEVINKNLSRINITAAPWFERFSMVYAGIVKAVETVSDPGAVLREAVGGLREMVGSFFGSVKARVGDVAGMLKDQLKQISNPAQLMQRLADKAVEMVLNFIVTHPPSALVKVAFKAIETGARTSIVELVRQNIPFADKLIQRIAQSDAVRTLLQPLQGPATAVSGATERVVGAAGGLVNEVESRVAGLVSDGAQMVKQLSGIEVDQLSARAASDMEQPAAGQRARQAGGGLGGESVLGVIGQGLHTRLLAIGSRNLAQRGKALGQAALDRGLAAGKSLAGTIRGLLLGEVVDFEARGEQHQLWVEDQDGEIEVMVASKPTKLEQRIAKFEAALPSVTDAIRKRVIETRIGDLKTLSKIPKGRGKVAKALEKQKQRLVETIRELLKHPEMTLDEAEMTFSDLGRELRTRRKDIDMRVAAEVRQRAPEEYRAFVRKIRDLAAAAAVKDVQFMGYWKAAHRTDNWTNAGSRFHKLAQDIGQELFEKPGEWPFADAVPYFELQVAGGHSRFDVLIVQFEPTFMLYEFDYKTGSRSAAASVDEMKQHFRDVRKDMGHLMQEQLMQESVSWREAVERELNKLAAAAAAPPAPTTTTPTAAAPVTPPAPTGP